MFFTIKQNGTNSLSNYNKGRPLVDGPTNS